MQKPGATPQVTSRHRAKPCKGGITYGAPSGLHCKCGRVTRRAAPGYHIPPLRGFPNYFSGYTPSARRAAEARGDDLRGRGARADGAADGRRERVRHVADGEDVLHARLVARVEGAELLPLSRFAEWAGALDPDEELVVMCHHGIRSGHVCAHFARKGFTKLHNLAGGIDRWSTEVDRSVPRY